MFLTTFTAQSAVKAVLSTPKVIECNPSFVSFGTGNCILAFPFLSVGPLNTAVGPSRPWILEFGFKPRTSIVAFCPTVALPRVGYLIY